MRTNCLMPQQVLQGRHARPTASRPNQQPPQDLLRPLRPEIYTSVLLIEREELTLWMIALLPLFLAVPEAIVNCFLLICYGHRNGHSFIARWGANRFWY